MSAGRIFLDNAAGAPLHPDAAALIAELHREGIGNPNGGHAEARRARAVLDAARASLAEDFDVEPRTITFTSTASEALALALASELQSGGTLITSAGEHRGARALAAAHEASGGRVALLPLDASGRWSAEALQELLTATRADGVPPVMLLALASGEVGAVQPSLTAVNRDSVAAVLDGVQLDGAREMRFADTGATHLALSSAKVGGPFGVAGLISADPRRIRALVPGGGQERGRRGGTEAVVLAAAYALAHRLHRRSYAASVAASESAARAFDAALGVPGEIGLIATGPDPRTAQSGRLPGHRSFAADWVLGDDLVAALDHAGVAASTGSACISGSREASEALLAMGLSRTHAAGGLRLTFGGGATADDAARAAAALRAVAERIRQHAGVTAR